MKRRAYSSWGYEVSACQTCGRASVFDPCRLCRAPKLKLVAPLLSPGVEGAKT